MPEVVVSQVDGVVHTTVFAEHERAGLVDTGLVVGVNVGGGVSVAGLDFKALGDEQVQVGGLVVSDGLGQRAIQTSSEMISTVRPWRPSGSKLPGSNKGTSTWSPSMLITSNESPDSVSLASYAFHEPGTDGAQQWVQERGYRILQGKATC